MSDSDPTLASLVVFEYHLGGMGGGYRYKSVRTRLAFTSYGAEESQNRPLIAKFEPAKQLNKDVPTEVEHKTKRRAEVSLGARFAPAEADLKLGEETEEEYKLPYHASFQAFPESPLDGTSEPYAVEWEFWPNKKTKTGIPDMFRVAVLIERKNSDRFECTFTLKLNVGGWPAVSKALKAVFGRPESDSPIIFDPSRKPQGEVKGINASSLGDYKDSAKMRRLGPIHFFE